MPRQQGEKSRKSRPRKRSAFAQEIRTARGQYRREHNTTELPENFIQDYVLRTAQPKSRAVSSVPEIPLEDRLRRSGAQAKAQPPQQPSSSSSDIVAPNGAVISRGCVNLAKRIGLLPADAAVRDPSPVSTDSEYPYHLVPEPEREAFRKEREEAKARSRAEWSEGIFEPPEPSAAPNTSETAAETAAPNTSETAAETAEPETAETAVETAEPESEAAYPSSSSRTPFPEDWSLTPAVFGSAVFPVKRTRSVSPTSESSESIAGISVVGHVCRSVSRRRSRVPSPDRRFTRPRTASSSHAVSRRKRPREEESQEIRPEEPDRGQEIRPEEPDREATNEQIPEGEEQEESEEEEIVSIDIWPFFL